MDVLKKRNLQIFILLYIGFGKKKKIKKQWRRRPMQDHFSSLVVRWNVIVRGEAKSVDGSLSETEDWYLVGLRSVDGEWKVEDVRVNVAN